MLPQTVSVERNGTWLFTPVVAWWGDRVVPRTVTWTVTGGVSGDTAISGDGLLTVGADETAAVLTVTATSTVNSQKYGSATVTVTGNSPPAAMPGDVSGDGEVDSTDARMVLQYEVGLISLTDAQKTAADVSGDDDIDSTDARLILQYEVGLITQFL